MNNTLPCEDCGNEREVIPVGEEGDPILICWECDDAERGTRDDLKTEE